MARIDRHEIGSQGEVLPKLEAHMIQGRKTVLTLAYARQVKGKFGSFLAIGFKEFPEHEMITNATQEDALLALVDTGRLNDDLDRWHDTRVAFEKRTNRNPENGKMVEKLYAIDPTEQDAALDDFDKATSESEAKPRGRTSAAKK